MPFNLKASIMSDIFTERPIPNGLSTRILFHSSQTCLCLPCCCVYVSFIRHSTVTLQKSELYSTPPIQQEIETPQTNAGNTWCAEAELVAGARSSVTWSESYPGLISSEQQYQQTAAQPSRSPNLHQFAAASPPPPPRQQRVFDSTCGYQLTEKAGLSHTAEVVRFSLRSV